MMTLDEASAFGTRMGALWMIRELRATLRATRIRVAMLRALVGGLCI